MAQQSLIEFLNHLGEDTQFRQRFERDPSSVFAEVALSDEAKAALKSGVSVEISHVLAPDPDDLEAAVVVVVIIVVK